MSEPYILIVDDEPDIRSMLELILRRAGFEVGTASSGEAALEQFASRRPDAIVLDINMPGILGLDVCREVKAQSAVPVLMMTGNCIIEMAAKVEAVGADGLLGKPFEIASLLEQLHTLLGRQPVALARQVAA
jgi:DNA-binding response OmpR family regulator